VSNEQSARHAPLAAPAEKTRAGRHRATGKAGVADRFKVEFPRPIVTVATVIGIHKQNADVSENFTFCGWSLQNQNLAP
jgi:hypothetical protein